MTALVEQAPAKVNLTLRIVSRRADGYHALESLVAFADIGDTLAMPVAGASRLFRLTRLTDGTGRRIEARAIEPTVQDITAGASPLPSLSAPPVPGPPHALVIDPPFADADQPALQYLAVAADPWPAAYTLWRSVDGESFSALSSLRLPALIGQTTTALGPGPLWRLDRATRLGIRLSGDGIAAVDPERMLAGANLLAVQGPDCSFELLGFADAVLTGERQWTLSTLLRGLGASEALASRSLAPGAPVVIVDEALASLTADPGDLYRSYRYRLTPTGSDVADPAMLAFTAAAGPLPLRPFAPVGLKAVRQEGGVLLSWIRRTRRGGDSWDLAEVPLAEESEAYQVDILDGGSVKRTLACALPQVLYTQEAADFGGSQTSLTLSVCQMSAAVRRGFTLSATVPVL